MLLWSNWSMLWCQRKVILQCFTTNNAAEKAFYDNLNFLVFMIVIDIDISCCSKVIGKCLKVWWWRSINNAAAVKVFLFKTLQNVPPNFIPCWLNKKIIKTFFLFKKTIIRDWDNNVSIPLINLTSKYMYMFVCFSLSSGEDQLEKMLELERLLAQAQSEKMRMIADQVRFITD